MLGLLKDFQTVQSLWIHPVSKSLSSEQNVGPCLVTAKLEGLGTPCPSPGHPSWRQRLCSSSPILSGLTRPCLPPAMVVAEVAQKQDMYLVAQPLLCIFVQL